MSDDYKDMPPLEDETKPCNTPQSQTSAVNDMSIECPIENIEDESDENEEEWEEEETEFDLRAKCLFCEVIQPNPCAVFHHMALIHHFDMFSNAATWDLDQVSYIKFVNFVRSKNPSVQQVLASQPAVWESQEFMKAHSPGDMLLTFDVEDFYEDSSDQEAAPDVVELQKTCDDLRAVIKKQSEAFKHMLDRQKDGKLGKTAKTISEIDEEEDKGYFNSYAYYDIHHEMLSDKVRTEAYRAAILGNKPIFENRNVLDLGCGTGILSMFAAQAGGRVTGVDMSSVIYQAMDIVKENNLDCAISLRKGRLEDMNFNVKFDVIVSEWMGYFLLFEGMLDSVINAREQHLADGGILLPNRCTMYLLGADDMDSHNKYVQFWTDVYGFKMTCLGNEAIKEATTEIINENVISTSPVQIADFNLMTMTTKDTEFSSDFEMIFNRDGQLTSFVGYFDTYFELPNPVSFSTGPNSAPTHWKQTIFFLPKVRPHRKGEVLRGKIIVQKKRKELRSLDVLIMFDDVKYRYFVE